MGPDASDAAPIDLSTRVAALPGFAIFITSICFNLVSDGLRTPWTSACNERHRRPPPVRTAAAMRPSEPHRGPWPDRASRSTWSKAAKHFPVGGGAPAGPNCPRRRRRLLRVRKGETLGIVGKSGCGKSTTGAPPARARPRRTPAL